METQDIYQKTIKFAAEKHAAENQTIPGSNLPYVVHLSNVAMEILLASNATNEFNTNFAIQIALLHDTLEDTKTTLEELTYNFGKDVAEAVSALTKRANIPKADRMNDSLNRIKLLAKEVGAVKLADRITNLQSPPHHWDLIKIQNYRLEAIKILEELKGTNSYLENRLQNKIDDYLKYCI